MKNTKEIVGCVTGNKYKIKRLNFGERNRVLDESSTQDPDTGLIKLKTGTMRMLYIQLGVTEPKLSVDNINALPEAEGQQIAIEVRKLSTAPLES